jgi:hypothetical protein
MPNSQTFQPNQLLMESPAFRVSAASAHLAAAFVLKGFSAFRAFAFVMVIALAFFRTT